MKRYLIALLLFVNFNCFGQLKTYLSSYQISESDASVGTVPYKVIIDEGKLDKAYNGYVKLIDVQQNSTLLTLKTKYLKTTNDEDGTTYWFKLYGNPKFNVVKECLWAKPQNIKGNIYRSIIIFSNYDDNGTRINDLGFLSNVTSDKRRNDAVETNNAPSTVVTGTIYQVVAQKAYFYDLTEHGASRRNGYLVKGEPITALKEKDGLVYCEFTNVTTKKTSKGWISKDCLDKPNSIIPPVNTDNSAYTVLLKYDGRYTQEVNFFKQPIVVTELKKMMGNNYSKFVSTFLSSCAGVQIKIRNKVLMVDTFIPHAGPNNRVLFFIDAINHQSFLYWNDSDGKNNFFGKAPVSNIMKHCMEQQLQTNPQYGVDADRSIMKIVLEKATL
ncbi:hypothetical protein FFF34_003110 [Inquilinus sp. KBS0705]|nr:hypothetical protein FFF34_003110 [Inquilinus sp. KBS0705]